MLYQVFPSYKLRIVCVNEIFRQRVLAYVMMWRNWTGINPAVAAQLNA